MHRANPVSSSYSANPISPTDCRSGTVRPYSRDMRYSRSVIERTADKRVRPEGGEIRGFSAPSIEGIPAGVDSAMPRSCCL